MCNSTSLTQKQEKLERHYGAQMSVPLLYEPYYHRAAYSYPNLFIIPQEDPKGIYPASWGFVPESVKSNIMFYRKKHNSWNARSEGVFDIDSSFRKSIRNKRCLVLADGFFEPHYYPGNTKAVPHYCYIPESNGKRKTFVFAGLYSELDDELFSCTILTKEANPFFAEVHNKKKRMPLVLDDTFQNEWLNNFDSDKPIKEIIEHGFSKEDFHSHPVSTDLYKNVETNLPYIIEPVEPPLTLF